MKYLLTLLLVCFILLTACSKKSNSHSPSNLTKVKIAQFGKEKFLLYLPLYVAMEKGFFKKNGLAVELIFAGNDDQVFATVMSGDADFGLGDPVFTAIAQEKGFPAKTVAMMITSLGISGYTNNLKVPEIKKPADFAGLRVGSFPAPSTTYTLLTKLINDNKEALKNTVIVQSAFGTHLALLEAGKVDIAVDIEPTVSIAEHKGYRVVFDMTPFTERQAITGVMVTQKTIDERPEIVQKVVNSYQEAINLMYADPNVSYEVGKKLYPQQPENVIKNAVDRMIRYAMYPKSIVVEDSLWQTTIRTRVESGELKSPQPTEKAVDNRFAEKAQNDLK